MFILTNTMGNISIKDGAGLTQYYQLEGEGSSAAPFKSRSPVLLGEPTSTPAIAPTDTATISSLLKGFWAGIGVASEAASVAGSLMARVRLIAIAFSSPQRNVKFSSGTAFTVKTTAGQLVSVYCYNKSSDVRFFQLFDLMNPPPSNAVPVESYAIAPSSILILGSDFLGLGGIDFGTGISWGFSTTEFVYTPATATENTTLIRFR